MTTATDQENNSPEIPSVDIEQELRKSYLDYAMSVIVGRALPDVRDGLKPVHRRTLYAMRELGNTHNRPYVKSARIVGDCFVQGTLVHTEDGLCPVEEIEIGQHVQLPDSSLRPVVEVFHNRSSKIVRVNMSNGFTFDVTPGQLYRVLHDDLTIGWEKAANLEGKTVLVSNACSLGMPETHPDPEQSDLAYIIGLLVAEGFLADRGRGRRVGICMTDEEPLEFVSSYCETKGISAKWNSVSPKKEHWRWQKNVRFTGLDQAYEACEQTCESKRVPRWILQDRCLFAPFLAGFSDGDGYFRIKESKREAVMTSASRLLLVQIQAMLADSGIHCTLTCEDFESRSYGDGCLNRYNLWITGEHASMFCALVRDFLKIEKKRRAAFDIAQWNKRCLNSAFESLPGRLIFQELSDRHLGGGWYRDKDGRKFRAGIKYPGGAKIRYKENLAEKELSYRQIQQWGILSKLERIGSDLAPKLRRLMDTYCFMQVESVEAADEQDTYDIQIDSSEHEFLVHGFAVHNCIGKYHPHGDSAVYDTLVRMAQDFSLRYPLVDGQGNFGSMDGDPPAAMRYTEARMAKLDQELVADIEKETVDFIPTYDNSQLEPTVLPSKIPNILINGSEGIAVGMATKIPPHNLTEVIDGLTALVDDPELSVHQLMAIITGPDFPTGGFICGRAGIREAYETGRGVIVMRARMHVEKKKKSGEAIVVTEIPFQQNKAKLVKKIALLMKEKRITSIAEVRDESDRHGLRVVMDLKKDEIPEVTINQLFKMTPLQKSFGIIMLCIVNNKPEILNLKEVLVHFIEHRRTVIYRRTAFELRKAEERAHLLEGLKIALDNLDEVVQLIRSSPGPAEAKAGLIERFELSELQAQVILDMRLQKLTGLERDKIIQEYTEIMERIAWLSDVLADDALVMNIVREEFKTVREQYGDERRTEIIEASDEILPEDMITPEEMVVTVSLNGYIKRNQLSLYRAQRRGGKGVAGMAAVEDDFVTNLYTASTLDTFLFFTNKARVFWRKVYELPMAGRTARGRAVVNLLELGEEEKLAAILSIPGLADADESYTILTVTKKGRVKKTSIAEYKKPVRKGKLGLTIKDDDEILCAAMTSGDDHVFLVTKKGLSIHFHEDNVRTMGRTAAGVKGITLAEDDEVVAAVVLKNHEKDDSILTVTEKGYGKRTAVSDYRLQKRGGKGVFAIKTSDRNGMVVGALQVVDDDQVMLIADSAKVIRLPMDSMRIIGRNTQGVRMINLNEGEKVVALSMLARNDDAVDDDEIDDSPEDGEENLTNMQDVEQDIDKGTDAAPTD